MGAALLALTVWGFFGLNRHLIVAIDQCGDAATGIEQTTAALSGKHGTIAMVDEDAGAAKSLIVHADLVARHEQQSLNAWDTNGTVLFNNINGTVTDLRGTVNASTDLVKAATQTAQIMNNGLPVTLAEVNHSPRCSPRSNRDGQRLRARGEQGHVCGQDDSPFGAVD